jgi:hypothetical protein
MNTVTVTNQVELDIIPTYYDGQIVIDGGGEDNPIVIRHKYYLDPLVINTSIVMARAHVNLTAKDNAMIRAYQYAKIKAFDSVTVTAAHSVKVSCHGKCRVVAKGTVIVNAFGRCNVILRERAQGKASGNVVVMGYDRTRSYLRQSALFYRCSPTALAYFQDRAKEVV